LEAAVTKTWTETDLLVELEPVVEGELNRHTGIAKEWFPHEYVPWSEGRNYDGLLNGDRWQESDSRVSEVARSALIVNLLTEDNLPSYHHEIALLFGRDGAWGDWVHRWTAEEGRHGIAMRDYLLVTRAVDPVALERFRMEHMGAGYVSAHSEDLLCSLAYVSFQELATRVSHRNTGRFTQDPLCDQLLTRIAADENLHMIFYRNLLNAALQLAPDQTMQAINDVVKTFAMPGTGIPGFSARLLRWRLPESMTSASIATRWSRPFSGFGACSTSRASPLKASAPAPSSRTSWRAWRRKRCGSRTNVRLSRHGARPAADPAGRRPRGPSNRGALPGRRWRPNPTLCTGRIDRRIPPSSSRRCGRQDRRMANKPQRQR